MANLIPQTVQGKTFKINEVCSIAGVKPYVLRFWESEFHEISPRIDENDIRYYDHQDIEAISLIKKLLFEEKLTIEKTKLELKLRVVKPELSPHGPPEIVIDGPKPEVKEPIFEGSQKDKKVFESDQKIKTEEGFALNPEELEKLVLAKKKLNGIVSLTNSLKQSHDWD
ncbi:MAG: MerR family transcriptional regulator [Bdellovibrionota bacterium]|nr:MerR family transcriptional regulator [Bdellovibrionota bacterium]MEC8624142.1 MerR family transcriptional regulator [Bdellovibrionota bacterium]